MYRSVFYRVRKRDSKGSMTFRALIESPDEHDAHIQIFDELEASDYICEITPISLDDKVYDFFFHESLREAQKFCETLGYEIVRHAPNEAIWKRKLFSVK